MTLLLHVSNRVHNFLIVMHTEFVFIINYISDLAKIILTNYFLFGIVLRTKMAKFFGGGGINLIAKNNFESLY